MLNFDLQNHRPLREIVYEELKRQIMIGEIPQGTRMMEVERRSEKQSESWKKKDL